MKRLVVISHVTHYRHGGQLYAFGPYSREIDIWADLFPEVVIAAPCRNQRPPGDCLAFGRDNISIQPIRQTGGDRWMEKLQQLGWLPLVMLQLCRVMSSADAIHVRCPGNLGLLGVVLARFFSPYRVAKFAGQWNGYAGETRAGRLQRRLLKSRWWGSPVTVYGEWPGEPAHVHSFFTSMMTDDQVAAATAAAEQRRFSSPLRVMFAGRLVREKRIDVFLEAVGQVSQRGVALEVRIVGDGPRRAELERQAATIAARAAGTPAPLSIEFTGALPFDQSLENYRWADCLVLASVHSEGWPKVIAEAMCHGLICVAVDHGQVGRMLQGRGLLLASGEAEGFADAICRIAADPAKFQEMSVAASAWARQYSLDGLRAALAELLQREWQVTLTPPTLEGKASVTRAVQPLTT